MKKGYACIAYSIGRGINQRREIVEADPLPDRLLDLLRTLREKDDQNSEGAVSDDTQGDAERETDDEARPLLRFKRRPKADFAARASDEGSAFSDFLSRRGCC